MSRLLTIRISEAEQRAFQRHAKRRGLTLSDWIRRLAARDAKRAT
jgi:antitoxin component of RelBE/YafQ-DinJ toxin-antitoxin module